MPVQRLYALFAGPGRTWEAFDFTSDSREHALRRRGQFIATSRRGFAQWAIQDDCTGPPDTTPPLHLTIYSNEVRARQHGALR